MGKCCGCCPCCRSKKKKRKSSVAKVSSTSLSLFNIPDTEDGKVITLESLPMSIEDIEAHYSDMRNIYTYAIETMKNFLGNVSYPYNTMPKQLYPYIMHLCEGLPAHEYLALKEYVAEKELSNIQVTITIKDAKLVHPKITDFSRIFCKLWIDKEDERFTTIKESTSHLLWDETFILDVTNYESNVINLEVWSARSETGALERLNLTQERFKEDDPLAEEKGMFFIGDTFEYVKSLPCVGQNVLWAIKKGPRRSFTKGQLNLYLHLGTKKTPDFMLHLYCHMTFIRLCYERRVLKEDESHSFWTNWLEILPNAALTLIQQHAIQHGITPAEQCMSIAELRLCTNYMDSFEVLQEECSEWYLQVIKNKEEGLKEDESVEKLCEVLRKIMKKYLKNQIVLDNIFRRAWNICYTSITYKELDKVVCVTLRPMIKHLVVLMDDPAIKNKRRESLLMLQLYHNVRNLVNYMLNIVSVENIVLGMDEYSAWFGEELVLEWFLLCDLYTSQFIRRAVLADNMVKLDAEIFHGTSIPDMISIIDEMVIDVWMKLSWKDKFYTHGALIEAIKSSIVYYSKSMLDRIETEKFFCHFDKFEMSKKLCVAMSNMCALSEHVLRISKKIREELEGVESTLGFELSQPLLSVLSKMQIMTSEVLLLVFKKLSKRIKTLVIKAVKDRTGSVTSGQLCLYMDTTLEVMYLNLKHEAFYIILRHMWVILLYKIKKRMNFLTCFMTKKRIAYRYMVILQILNQMKNIFFCDGHGLTQPEMESKVYEEIRNFLENKLAVK